MLKEKVKFPNLTGSEKADGKWRWNFYFGDAKADFGSDVPMVAYIIPENFAAISKINMYTGKQCNVFVGAEFYDRDGLLILRAGDCDIANDNMATVTLE